MENSKVALSHQEAFDNKKNFSNKIHSRVLRVTEEILESLEKIPIVNDEDTRLFLNAVNHYYRDLCTIVFHLRQVAIKIDVADEGVHDLQNVINGINKIVLHLQESLNLKGETFKTQLKNTITDVGSQVENLMKIIKYDNLHEHKQDVLDCQHDLVISAEALKLYCQFCYLNPSELESLVHEVIQKIKNNLIKVKTDHELMEEDFAHYTRHSVKHLANTVNYSRKMYSNENFPTDVADVFKNADVLAVEFMTELLEAVRSDNPMVKMLDIIENGHDKVSQASVEVQKGVRVAMLKSTGGKDHEAVKQLMIHLFINCINGLSAINQSIEDAIMRR